MDVKFSDQELSLFRIGLKQYLDALNRQLNKYPEGSQLSNAYTTSINEVQALLNRI